MNKIDSLLEVINRNSRRIKVHNDRDNEFSYQYEGLIDLKVKIVDDNILHQKVDIIVVPIDANFDLTKTIIGKYIKRKTGSEIDEKLSILPETGVVNYGYVHVTKSIKFKKISYIMYVVDSLDKSCIEEKSRDGIIKKMFLDVLYSAEKLDNVATIAIPILSLNLSIAENVGLFYKALSEYITLTDSETRKIKKIKIAHEFSTFNQVLINLFKECLKLDGLLPSSEKQNFDSLSSLTRKLSDRFVEVLKFINCNNNICYRNTCEKYMEKIETLEKNLHKACSENLVSKENSFIINEITVFNKTSNLFSFCFNQVDLRVEISKSDIFETPCNAIVNLTNHKLLLIGSFGQLIKDRTGDAVQNECNAYLATKADNQIVEKEVFVLKFDFCSSIFKFSLSVKVLHTKSFLKNCDFIIHSNGTTLYKILNNENKAYHVLQECFLNVIKHADEKLQVQSISFPFNEKGIWYIDVNECCERLFKAIKQFIKDRKDKSSNGVLNTIKIICSDDLTALEFIDYFYEKLLYK